MEIKEKQIDGILSYEMTYRLSEGDYLNLHVRDYTISSDGNTTDLRVEDYTVTNPNRPQYDLNYSFYMSTGRDGVVSPPTSTDIILDGVTYHRDEDAMIVTAISGAKATIRASVSCGGENLPVTEIKVPYSNAKKLSILTIEKKPNLKNIDIPEIDELWIQESPQEWCQKDFPLWQQLIDPGYNIYAWRSDNGIFYAKKVFFNGKALTEIVIGADAEKIGDGAFNGLKQLQSVKIVGRPKIGKYAFAGCPDVSKVDAPDTEYALRQKLFGMFDTADYMPYIGGKQMTVLYFLTIT